MESWAELLLLPAELKIIILLHLYYGRLADASVCCDGRKSSQLLVHQLIGGTTRRPSHSGVSTPHIQSILRQNVNDLVNRKDKRESSGEDGAQG